MSESFLDYRKRLQKLERYHSWRGENEKTFYRPQSHEAKVGGEGHWSRPVDAAFRMNIRRYDLAALGDEDWDGTQHH